MFGVQGEIQVPFPGALTHYWINCGGALREANGITDIHNVCILWHIGTYYQFTHNKQEKYRDAAGGPLPTYNVFNGDKLYYLILFDAEFYIEKL